MAPRQILLIDDDRLQHQLVKKIISQFRTGPWEFDGALDFTAGLKKLVSGRHAVCLLDYRLGKDDGLELLRAARAAGCTVPVVVLTADDSVEVEDAAMEAGAMDFLVKREIDVRVLERSIRYARKLGETLERLNQLATRDGLTGLLNRREFERILEEEWQRSVRFERPFTLLLVDIDHFKQVNDTHGHQVGDEVLRHVASLLAGQLRSVDRVARYGGEEFAIIMVESGCGAAMERMQRICALLEDMPCIVGEKGLAVTVTLSAGVAEMIANLPNAARLITLADKALYAAKDAGRNRILPAKHGRRASS